MSLFMEGDSHDLVQLSCSKQARVLEISKGPLFKAYWSESAKTPPGLKSIMRPCTKSMLAALDNILVRTSLTRLKSLWEIGSPCLSSLPILKNLCSFPFRLHRQSRHYYFIWWTAPIFSNHYKFLSKRWDIQEIIFFFLTKSSVFWNLLLDGHHPSLPS